MLAEASIQHAPVLQQQTAQHAALWLPGLMVTGSPRIAATVKPG